MEEAPAKGVNITFSYSGQVSTKTYKAGANISEGRAVYLDKAGTVLPVLSAEEQEHERELAWSQSMDWPIGEPFEFGKPLTPQESRRIAIERWRNPFAKEIEEDELQS
jgi:hypothetical protein